MNIDNLVKSVLDIVMIIPIETIHMLLEKLMFTEQTCEHNHITARILIIAAEICNR